MCQLVLRREHIKPIPTHAEQHTAPATGWRALVSVLVALALFSSLHLATEAAMADISRAIAAKHWPLFLRAAGHAASAKLFFGAQRG